MGFAFSGRWKFRGLRQGQSVMEMAVLLIVITASVIAMQVYLKRGIQGSLREQTDMLGSQYDPATTTSEMNMIRNSAMITTTRTTTVGPRTVILSSGMYAGAPAEVNVLVSTMEMNTLYDNTSMRGYEVVGGF